MSHVLTFEISRDDKALVYINSEEGMDITCLIDTGANVPIWFTGDRILKMCYPSAKPTDKLTIIKGLGQGPLLNVPIWKIPEFVMKDEYGNKIVFYDLLIPVIEAKKYAFDMLIPLTMLNRLKFSFDYKKAANYGYFTIEAEKDNYYIRPLYYPDNDKYLNRIQAFAQEGV